jgi:predicted ATPase
MPRSATVCSNALVIISKLNLPTFAEGFINGRCSKSGGRNYYKLSEHFKKRTVNGLKKEQHPKQDLHEKS